MSFWAIRVADGQPQGRPELIKEDVGRRIWPMGLTREGSLYYGIDTGMIDVYTASLDFKTGKLLDQPSRAIERFVGSNSNPDLSPDGRYLAYISRRGLFESAWQGSFLVCIRSLETGEERDLAPKLRYITDLRWSPDGRSILLLATDSKNRGGLHHMDVKSGNVAPLMQVGGGVMGKLPFIAGNWKMNKTVGEALDLVRELKAALSGVKELEVGIAPPFTALFAVRKELEGSPILLAAQNLFWEEKGAFTGEVSPLMLKEVGCSYVIIGHSERRQFFGETDETVNRRIKAALNQGLKIIFCIGETLREREEGNLFSDRETRGRWS